MDQAFYGDMGEQGFPAGQDQGLPEPSHSSVAVLKGVNEFEFVMEDRTGD